MRTLMIGGAMDEKVAKTPRPHMLDADEVAELLRIKKGSAYDEYLLC